MMGHGSYSLLSSVKGGALFLGYSAAQHQAGMRGLWHSSVSPGGLVFTDWGPHPQSLSIKFEVLLQLSGKHTVRAIAVDLSRDWFIKKKCNFQAELLTTYKTVPGSSRNESKMGVGEQRQNFFS